MKRIITIEVMDNVPNEIVALAVTNPPKRGITIFGGKYGITKMEHKKNEHYVVYLADKDTKNLKRTNDALRSEQPTK